MIRLLTKTFLADGIFNGADLLLVLMAVLILYLFMEKPVKERGDR